MHEVIMQLARTINEQKGESLGTHALLLGIIKSFAPEQRDKVFDEFDKEIATLRSALASSNSEREVSEGVEEFVRLLEGKRIELDRS